MLTKARLLRMLLLAGVVSVALACFSKPTRAQSGSDSQDDEHEVDCSNRTWATLDLHGRQKDLLEAELEFCFDPAREVEMRQGSFAALGCPEEDEEFTQFKDAGLIGLDASCHLRFARSRMRRSAEVDLTRLEKLLQSAGVSHLRITVWVPGRSEPQCFPSPEQPLTYAEGIECNYTVELPETTLRSLRLCDGYSQRDAAGVAGPLALLLAMPIAMTMWLRRRALRAREDEKAAVSFGYFRLMRLTTLGAVLVWWTAIDLTHADRLVAFFVPDSLLRNWLAPAASIAPWIFLWLGPAFVYFVCLVLSAPIHALRGDKRTRGQIWNQSFWGVARLLIPLTLMFLGIEMMTASPRAGVLLLATAIVTWRLAQQRFADSYGLQLHGLTSGELRDRTFALAQNGGAKLQQLYVLPTERMRLANAFAHYRNNIFLTDYLLKNMSKREVDAVVAHEVTHLGKKHIGQRLAVYFFVLILCGIAAIYFDKQIPENFPTGPAVYALILFGVFFVARRNEYAADAGAVKLTHDPEAMMTALARLSLLNKMPIHWGKADEQLLTHPSTLRRIARIAKANNMPEARVPELLAQSANAPADVYTIPATALPEGKAFSTRYKTRLSARLAWTILLTMAAIPTAAGYYAQSAQLEGAKLGALYGAGVAVMVGVGLLLTNVLPARNLGKLEDAVKAKLDKRGVAQSVLDGTFVSLSPDDGPRIYEGNWSWDVGLLSISLEQLCYRGEEAVFRLRREEVTRVELGRGPVGWWRVPAVYVYWSDRGRERAMNFRMLHGASSMRRMATLTRRLFRDLENWHRGMPAAADSVVATPTSAPADLSAPGFGNVTSLAPGRMARGTALSRDILLNTFLAAGIATVLNLQFPPVSESGGSAGLYLLVCVWIGRVFLLWPYWSSRDASRVTTAPQRAPAPTAASQR